MNQRTRVLRSAPALTPTPLPEGEGKKRRSFAAWVVRAAVAVTVLLAAPLAAENPRTLKVDDIFALKNVGDPHFSPDGQWVAYTVRSLDPKEDAANTDLYM